MRIIYISIFLFAYIFTTNVLAVRFLILPDQKVIIKEDETRKKRFVQVNFSFKQAGEVQQKKVRSSLLRKLKGVDRHFHGIINSGGFYIYVCFTCLTLKAHSVPLNRALLLNETRGPPATV